jgi:hypothetical protein
VVHVGASAPVPPDGAGHVFLLEAYVAPGTSDVDPVGQVLAAIRKDPALHLLGTVLIPGDEAMLCLIEAPGDAAAESLLRRLGHDAIRVVEVRWVPTRSD